MVLEHNCMISMFVFRSAVFNHTNSAATPSADADALVMEMQLQASVCSRIPQPMQQQQQQQQQRQQQTTPALYGHLEALGGPTAALDH
jgi:alpha-D-ribose 1-methylphosphonate 5-triphosphate synthase subunit PhnG